MIFVCLIMAAKIAWGNIGKNMESLKLRNNLVNNKEPI